MAYRLEKIKWADHTGHAENNWLDVAANADLVPGIINSVGYVVKEDRISVILVPHIGEGIDIGSGAICIIKTCIVKRWKLRDPA